MSVIVSEESKEKEWPQVRMERQQREGCIHIRDPHEVVLLQKPGYLLVRVQGVLEERKIAMSVQARSRMVASRTHLCRFERFANRAHGEDKSTPESSSKETA